MAQCLLVKGRHSLFKAIQALEYAWLALESSPSESKPGSASVVVSWLIDKAIDWQWKLCLVIVCVSGGFINQALEYMNLKL